MNDSPSSRSRFVEKTLEFWPSQPVPSVSSLRNLAVDGQADHVREAFERIPAAERARAAEPDILRQAYVGSRRRLAMLSGAQPHARDAERRFLESIVHLFVDACKDRRPGPPTLFQTLLEWAIDLRALSRLAEAETACDLAVDLGVEAYSDLAASVAVERARIQILLGRMDAAHTGLERVWRRRDRMADRHLVVAVLELFATTALETGRSDLYHHLLLERLRSFHTDAAERRTVTRLLRRTHRGARRLLMASGVPARDRILWLLHQGCLSLSQRIPVPAVSRGFERLSHGLAYGDRYVLPPRRNTSDVLRTRHARSDEGGRSETTLVTRAMGGIGDFLMMTPGLHELSRVRGRVALAIPRRYFPIFEENADVSVLDIQNDLVPESFETWFNLTDCPAARVESRTAPNVRANRIELFARGLGIRGWRLRAMDRQPRYHVTGDEARWCEAYLHDRHGWRHTDGGRPLIGVQPYTDELYRDLPHMSAIVDALAAHARVIVFGGGGDDQRSPRGVPSSLARYATGLTWRQSAAIAAGCDLIVAPDSAFFHLAAALRRPCLGLFGPTDGRIRAMDYPLARILDARALLPCVPCWRNDQTPCGLTGRRSSACLRHIDPPVVVETALEMLTTTDAERRASR